MKATIWKKRLSHYLLLLIAMVLMNFFFPRLMPGSPITRLIGDEAGTLTPEQRMRLLEFYNLDKPVAEQFVIFIKNTVVLDWGISFSKKQPIFFLLKNALPWTLLLTICNLLLSSAIGTFIGAVSAFLRKKSKDIKLVMAVTVLGTLPSFWVGMILLSVFSVRLGWFPLYGAASLWENKTGLAYLLDVARHVALPAATMVLSSFSIFFTTARYSVLNIMEQDYVTMAKMRGIPGWKIKRSYIFRNAMIPTFTEFMTQFGIILSGAVVIERLFSYPGLGLMLYDAVAARDYPLMQYVFLMISVMVVLTTFIADILNCRINPAMEAAYEE